METVGHFDLVDRIGVGGFGSVWRARDKELDRTVAVKIPRKGQLDPAEAEQFLRGPRPNSSIRTSLAFMRWAVKKTRSTSLAIISKD